jgi:hypothetical protein
MFGGFGIAGGSTVTGGGDTIGGETVTVPGGTVGGTTVVSVPDGVMTTVVSAGEVVVVVVVVEVVLSFDLSPPPQATANAAAPMAAAARMAGGNILRDVMPVPFRTVFDPRPVPGIARQPPSKRFAESRSLVTVPRTEGTHPAVSWTA